MSEEIHEDSAQIHNTGKHGAAVGGLGGPSLLHVEKLYFSENNRNLRKYPLNIALKGNITK